MNPAKWYPALARAFRSPSTAFIAALLIRSLALWLSVEHVDHHRNYYGFRGFETFALVHSLATGHGFAYSTPQYVPTAWLAPGYVWIVTVGELLSPKNGPLVVLLSRIFNIVISALTCYPVYFLAKKISNQAVGTASAFVWALLPVAILMPVEWTWDQSLTAFLLTCLLLLTYRVGESSSALLWCAYGALWGGLALTNPTPCLLLPFLALWLWFSCRKSARPSMRLYAWATLCFVLTLVPWTVRNWNVLGGFTFVKSNFGEELWLGNNPEASDTFAAAHHPFNNMRELEQLVSQGELNYSRKKGREALSFIGSHPSTFAKLCFQRVLDTWTSAYDVKTDQFIKPLGICGIYIAITTLFSIISLSGLAVGMKTDAMKWLPLAFAVVLLPIPYYITHYQQRYRHPIDPVMAIFAVLAAVSIGSWLDKRSRPLLSNTAEIGERSC